MESIRVGLMGLGIVGSGVARILAQKSQLIADQVGCPLELGLVLVREPEKERAVELPAHQLTTSPEAILDDPATRIVVEVMGGEIPAFEYVRRALEAGKHVVTANKEVMAKHGVELLALARHHDVDIYYEASVGGGIPLVAPFKHDLLANDITAVHAIINGTTNYILSRMAQEGSDFAEALRQAQQLGYAEPNPDDDIDGVDAAYKLAILATLAFHLEVRPQDVYREGVRRLDARDFRYARELGYAIKLLAIGKEEEGQVEVRVHPTLLPQDNLLARVDGVFNAVRVEGDLTGPVLFYGQGAGSLPTSSAVVANVIELARSIIQQRSSGFELRLNRGKRLKPMEEVETRYYFRMSVTDRPGVLAKIAQCLGDNQISIASVIQKEVNLDAGTAEIVIMTHPAKEKAVRWALSTLEDLEVVSQVGNFIRVEA